MFERYITADDAIYELERAFPADDFGKIIRCISRTPTADVVKVVRCKDCAHNEGSDNEPWCRIYECRKRKDGFCDEGERREDG